MAGVGLSGGRQRPETKTVRTASQTKSWQPGGGLVPGSGILTSAGREAAMPTPFHMLSGLGFTLVATEVLAQSRRGQNNNRKKEGREGREKSQEEIRDQLWNSLH